MHLLWIVPELADSFPLRVGASSAPHRVGGLSLELRVSSKLPREQGRAHDGPRQDDEEHRIRLRHREPCDEMRASTVIRGLSKRLSCAVIVMVENESNGVLGSLAKCTREVQIILK